MSQKEDFLPSHFPAMSSSDSPPTPPLQSSSRLPFFHEFPPQSTFAPIPPGIPPQPTYPPVPPQPAYLPVPPLSTYPPINPLSLLSSNARAVACITVACRMRELHRKTLNGHPVQLTVGAHHAKHRGFPVPSMSYEVSEYESLVPELGRQWKSNSNFEALVKSMEIYEWKEEDCILFVSLSNK